MVIMAFALMTDQSKYFKGGGMQKQFIYINKYFLLKNCTSSSEVCMVILLKRLGRAANTKRRPVKYKKSARAGL